MVELIKENGEIKVKSDYNDVFVKKARGLHGRWSKPYWIFDEEVEEILKEILNEIYGECGEGEKETVTIELDLEKYREYSDGNLKVANITVASRRYKESKVVLNDNAIVVKGGFHEKGGSINHPHVGPIDGTVIRVKISKSIYDKVKNLEGVTLLSEEINRENLLKEKERLLARLAEIEKILNE